MALTAQDLDNLASTGFGPMSITKKRGHWIADLDGRQATIEVDGVALAVAAIAPGEWPDVDGIPDDVVNERVQLVFDDLSMDRPDLTEVAASQDGTQVVATAWLDSEEATRGRLATTVRGVIGLANAAGFALASITAELRTEARLLGEAPAIADAAGARSAESRTASSGSASQQPASGATPATAPTPGPAAASVTTQGAAQPTAAQPQAAAEPRPAAAEAQPAAAEAQPAAAAGNQASQPDWVYVDAPTPMMGVDDTSRQVGQAAPGQWYRLESEAGGWALVSSTDGSRGWIAATAVRRQA